MNALVKLTLNRLKPMANLDRQGHKVRPVQEMCGATRLSKCGCVCDGKAARKSLYSSLYHVCGNYSTYVKLFRKSD